MAFQSLFLQFKNVDVIVHINRRSEDVLDSKVGSFSGNEWDVFLHYLS